MFVPPPACREVLRIGKESALQNLDRIKLTAALTGAFLLILCVVSLMYIFLPRDSGSSMVADIYQDGTLQISIALDQVKTPYSFTVTGEDGGENRVEVRSGSIGIVSADCPDRLCVRQGFLDAPGIPIVCLPHRLVIRLRPADTPQASEDFDIISY